MKLPAILLLCCVAATSALFLQQAPAKVYPVSKVVQLLTDMKAQLEKEADADEEVYEKLSCWCETNGNTKTKAIADAQTHISDLDGTVEKLTAANVTILLEIESSEKEVSKNQESLDTATALREKAHEAFIAEEKEMVQSIKALDAALIVLAKHHGGAALITDRRTLALVVGAAHTALEKHGAILQGTITPAQKRAIALLRKQTQAPDYFEATPTFKQAYTPQGGEIFGILKEMKETFSADLTSSQTEEVNAQQEYDGLKAAKENEISLGQADVQDKQQQLANTVTGLAEAKQDREDTYTSLGADKQFLMDLKLKCSMTDKDWEDRKKTRQEEISAMSEALDILSSDDARELFSRTYNPNATALLQVSQETTARRDQWRRSQAQAVLAAAAKASPSRLHGPQLAALSAAVRLDPFTRVHKAIDDMVTQLIAEKKGEVEQKDWCTGEFNGNHLSAEKEDHTKASLETKIAGFERKHTALTQVIDGLKEEIIEMNKQMVKAQEDRELEKKQFFTIQQDQQQAQKTLQEVLTVLQRVYAQQSGAASFLQQAPPKGFTAYKRHGGGTPVISLIENIIANARAMEVQTQNDEMQSQDAYTQFKEETTKSIEVKDASIVDRSSERSGVQDDLLQARSELSNTITEIERLTASKATLHKSCDYLITNFEVRQAARDAEVDALRNAKSYLAGMKP